MPKGKPKAKINKSQWIREQSANLTAPQVVELAAKDGIKLTSAQVYTARHEARKKAGEGSAPKAAAAAPVKVKGKPGPKPKAAVATVTASAGGNSLKTEFSRIALRAGSDNIKSWTDEILGKMAV